MIGDIKNIGGVQYFQADKEGTLVKLSDCKSASFWQRFWLEFRDCYKKWDMNEAIDFANSSRRKSDG